MDAKERAERILRGTAEAITADEVRALVQRSEHPRAYIGFEPSGDLTVAHLIPARKMRDLVEAGVALTVFLADWHAFVNDKLGGDLERIRRAGESMRAAFSALGVEGPGVRYRWASELVAEPGYWERVLRVSKAVSLARARRALTILGRQETEEGLDLGKFLYPALQVADIFALDVDLAYGGMDQRRAHVLAREVAHALGWRPVPAAIHTPLLPALSGAGRMDPSEGLWERKMSKSDPRTSVRLAASPSEVAERIGAAFCPAGVVDGNPVVIAAEAIVLPWLGRIDVDRPERYGGPVSFGSAEELRRAWAERQLHPSDLKASVAAALTRIAAPVRERLGRGRAPEPAGPGPAGAPL